MNGSLAKKLVAAMKDIDAVAKKGRNQKQGYDYVRASDVANEVRAVLIAQGIAFDFDVVSEERWERPTQSGGNMNFCQLKIGVTFTDSESGESKTVHTIGWGTDSLDKAPYKAMTGALKYALRMNFMIPDEADPENECSTPDPIQYRNGATHDAPKSAQTKPQEGLISEGQAKRFWAIAKKANKSDAEIKAVFKELGVEKTEQLKKSQYEDICAWAEGA